MSKRLLGDKEEREPRSTRAQWERAKVRHRNEGRYTEWKLGGRGWHMLGQQGWFILLCFDFLHQDGPEGEA